MASSRLVLVILVLLTMFSGLAGAHLVQASQGEEFFPQTGHWVRGEFLDFYRKSPDPLLLFGYPITEAMDHPQAFSNVTVQYFQRGRMELDPTAPEGERVKLAPLGEWLYGERIEYERANFAVTSGACRTFAATGKPVCYAFLQFYDAYQGSIYFGNPISEVVLLDGRPVQYFERARMEWRPEAEPGNRVALTDIGRLDFDISVANTEYTQPSLNAGPYQLIDVKVYAFPDQPLISVDERQAIFVIVKDQYLQPVPGAQVMVSVELPDGSIEHFRPVSTTSEDGFVKVDLVLHGLEPNQIVKVVAEASVFSSPDSGSDSSHVGKAETMFRVWW